MITKVMPTAVTQRNALSMNRVRKTWGDRKPVYMKEPNPYIATNRPMVTSRERYLRLTLPIMTGPPAFRTGRTRPS
jgi:hypothetical protein